MCNDIKFVLRHGTSNKYVRPDFSKVNNSFELSDRVHCVGLVPSVQGTFVFGRLNGYEEISNASIDDKFTLYAYRGTELMWQAYFYKTDCTITIESERVEVEVTHDNAYNSIFDVIEKTYNVVDFEPEKDAVGFDRRAILQIYMEGASTITNILDGISWETNAENLSGLDRSEPTLTQDYGFGILDQATRNLYGQAFIPYYGLSEDVSGEYIFSNPNQWFQRKDGAYTIREVSGSNDSQYEIVRADGTRVFLADNVPTVDPFSNSPAKRWPFFGFPSFCGNETAGAVFENVNNAAEKLRVFEFLPIVRLLSNKSEIDGVSGIDITGYQIGDEDNFAYKYAYPINSIPYVGYGDISFEPTYLPKVWDDGAMFENEYLKRYVDSTNGTAYPVGLADWTEMGFWTWLTNDLRLFMQKGSETGTVKDAFHLSSVIQKFLDEANENSTHEITFEASSQYSKFLYDSINPVSGAKRGFYFISPKTNILVDNYDFAAKRGDLTLEDVFSMLYSTHRLKWFIDAKNRLRIEHESYFENGGSYSGQVVGVDLTSLIESTTETNWSFFNSKYSYQKVDAVEQYLFKWMDEQSEYFTGFPIIANGREIETGSEQTEQISKFSSDIDFANSTNETVSKDGFFVLCAEYAPASDYQYKVIYESILFDDGRFVTMQNGRFAFCFLHEYYHRNNASSSTISINQREISALSVKRIRSQEIKLNGIISANQLSLCRTQLGVGNVISVVTNLENEETTIKTLLDTE